MKSKHGTVSVTSATWTELSDDFDILSWGVYSSVALYVQEYGISGWGSSISISAGEPYFKETSVKKIQVKAQSSSGDVNYSLLGFIAFRLFGVEPDSRYLKKDGSMYGDNIGETVTVSATDTYYEVPGGLSGGAENQMTFQNSKEIKVLKAGKYLVNYAITTEVGAAGQEIESEVLINGNGQDNTSNHAEAASANKPVSLSGTGILTLAVDDVVGIGLSNHISTQDILVDHVNLTLVMIGS